MSKYNDDYNNMICLDIFLSTLSKKNYMAIAPNIKSQVVLPNTSWDFSKNYSLNPVVEKNWDKMSLVRYAKEFQWKINLDDALNQSYDAIVLTDTNESIQWVNDGFFAMTGYDSKFAVGRSPRFLQSVNTDEEVIVKVKSRLSSHSPFTKVIVNYRKDKSEYLCEIHVIPIHNHRDELTHFMALERAV